MKSTRRLASLALPIGFLVCLLAPRGAAQTTNEDARFVFADTTLIRDTLGLTFERLFPLADSLRMTPAALKALSVNYRWTLARLVKMADSLNVPIDSVGPIMERERFNPLSNIATRNLMTYTSTYAPRATGDGWNNDLDYTVSRGQAFLVNRISVDMNQNGKGGSLGRQESRNARSSLSWRFSPRYSLGGEANLRRYDSVTRSGVNGEAERINDFGFTAQARPQPRFGFTPTLNAVGGLNSNEKLAEQKRGLTGTLSGALRYAAGTWISHDLNFTANSTISTASATAPALGDALRFPSARARDNSSNIRGTLNALRSRPVELSINYSFQNTRTQSPVAFQTTDSSIVSGPSGPETLRVVTGFTNKNLTIAKRRSLDGTLRFRQGDTRSLDLTWRTGLVDNASPSIVTANTTREDRVFSSSARYELGRLRLESSFDLGKGINSFPKRDFPKGGYREDVEGRTLDGSANWPLTRKLSAELRGSISLNISRYAAIDSPLTVPVARDASSQQYQFRVKYDPSAKATTTVSLQVSRGQFVNLAAASTASNSENRSYRANWSWSYRLLEGLTAGQSNAVTADYTSYPFAPASNRVSLDYSALTTLDAVLSRHLLMRIDHTSRFQPSGNYRPQSPADPTEYFSRADENLNYSLAARVYYTPVPAFSLNAAPEYFASDRNTTQNNTLSPQRQTRSLKLSGGANLNLRVGSRGKLSGVVSRSFDSSRTLSYGATGAGIAPRSEKTTLSGNLTFTWTL